MIKMQELKLRKVIIKGTMMTKSSLININNQMTMELIYRLSLRPKKGLIRTLRCSRSSATLNSTSLTLMSTIRGERTKYPLRRNFKSSKNLGNQNKEVAAKTASA